MSVPVLPIRLAACRVIRTLGSDDRAEVFLAQREDGAQVVIKRFAGSVPRAEVDRELTAIGRTEHPHVVRLLDAEVEADGRVLAVLERLSNGSLASWLEARDRVSAGEAVTVLAPLADALRTLHAAGVAHGRLATSRVLFDSAGAPVITGFGGAAIFAPGRPPAALERIPHAVCDLEALRTTGVLVLGRAVGSSALSEIRKRVEAAPPLALCELLADELFEHAAGSPVRFESPPPRLVQSEVVVRPGSERVPTSEGAAARVAELLDRGARGLVRDAARRWWARIDPGRRRLVVGVGAAVLAATVAVALVPGSPSSSRAVVREHATASPSATGPPDRLATSDDGDAVSGDDPVAAFAVLARTRERCLRDQDPACIGAVDERGSPAEAADSAAITDSRDAVPIPPATPRLVQLLGAAALVESGAPPARTLLVRTSDGWRIRDLPGAPQDG